MNNGGFTKVDGGYKKTVNEKTSVFIPEMCVKSFEEVGGCVELHAPKYEKKEPAKAAEVGINAYQYETQEEPRGCDFKLEIGHNGSNYLIPQKSKIELKGRGIKKIDNSDWYRVTDLALEKLEKVYKISYEMSYN